MSFLLGLSSTSPFSRWNWHLIASRFIDLADKVHPENGLDSSTRKHNSILPFNAIDLPLLYKTYLVNTPISFKNKVWCQSIKAPVFSSRLYSGVQIQKGAMQRSLRFNIREKLFKPNLIIPIFIEFVFRKVLQSTHVLQNLQG